MDTGVYIIKNIIDGKSYIGSASQTNTQNCKSGFNVRWKKHINYLLNNKHHNIHLQRAWNKYGKDNFIFEILEYCTPEKCLSLEQYYIDLLNPEYNICKVVNSRLGVKSSAETREKISISNRGRKLSEDHKIKIGQSNNKLNNPRRAKILKQALKGKKMSLKARINNRDRRRLHKSITKLSLSDVKNIKILLFSDIKLKIIAEKYKVSVSCISDIKHNRTWSDIKI